MKPTSRTPLRSRESLMLSPLLIFVLLINASGAFSQTTNNVNGNGNIVGGNVNVGNVNNNFGGGNGNGNQGGGSGDPLMLGFDGTLFFFHGEPKSCYNLLSEVGSYQVSTKLKEANNAVHIGSDKNGTYMEAIGFQQEDAKIEVSTFADDSARLVVKVNDVEMSMHDIIVHTPKTTLPLREGSVSLSVDFFQQHSGTVVTIVAPSIKLAVSLVPPGLDHAGYWQASYLNINVTLLRSPQGTVQGVIGDTYYSKMEEGAKQVATMDTPEATVLPTHLAYLLYPVFPDATYKLNNLFDKPALVFPPEFMQSVIKQRHAIARTVAATVAEDGALPLEVSAA